MKRSEAIQTAHELLIHPNLLYVNAVLDNINLSLQERDIISKSELQKMRMSEIQDIYNLSIDSIQRIKTNGMRKIAAYIALKQQ